MRGMALEMIIMLIMLLVVAGVIISLFLGTFQGDKFGKLGENAKLEQDKFRNFCQALCRDIQSPAKAAEFCETAQSIDWNGDNTYTKVEVNELTRMQVCENRIYCFQVYKCPQIKLNPGENDQAKACARASCKAFLESGQSTTTADDLVANTLTGRLRTGENDQGATCSLDFASSWFTVNVGQTPCSSPVS